ncbi:MAG TPA: DoxX family protein [Terriglobales bacterium]|nr:DoxX family protein [Terriglobales bacterium]
MTLPFLLGRIVFGGYFLYNGINHFKNRNALTQYAASKNVPLANIAVPVSGALLLFGAASLLLGIKPKYGATAVVAFLAGVSPMMHDFWRVEDANQRQSEMINFTKNMALLGAAVALMGVEEPWAASVPVAQPTPIDRARTFVRQHRVAA